MDEDRIALLSEFRNKLQRWNDSRNSDERAALREYLNQNKARVRQEVVEAGCYTTLTIAAPPAIGGMIHRRVDPFGTLFEKIYGMSLIPNVVDMLDATIGALKTPSNMEKKEQGGLPSIQTEVQNNYAFVAMPIDSSRPELEDVLDGIKESCARCGIQAERIDSVQSNERITDRILESIRRAEFVIVDLTLSRPNVFYEAGFSHGLGKLPIYIAREGTPLEFDLKDYPVIFFKNLKDLKDRLEIRLQGLRARSMEHQKAK